MSNNSKQSGLGGNPFSQGLFNRTTINEPSKTDIDSSSKNIDSNSKNIDSSSKNIDSSFLEDIENSEKESIGLQLTLEINDWLDQLVKSGRRKHGKKIPKQTWIQAGVELLKALPIDWTQVEDLDALRSQLLEIVEKVEN